MFKIVILRTFCRFTANKDTILKMGFLLNIQMSSSYFYPKKCISSLSTVKALYQSVKTSFFDTFDPIPGFWGQNPKNKLQFSKFRTISQMFSKFSNMSSSILVSSKKAEGRVFNRWLMSLVLNFQEKSWDIRKIFHFCSSEMFHLKWFSRTEPPKSQKSLPPPHQILKTSTFPTQSLNRFSGLHSGWRSIL
jgi:hypothetical protein